MATRMGRRSEKPGRPGGRSPAIAHVFARPELLRWALTHRSLAYESAPQTTADPQADNEQLEFLGDAVVGLIVAESLFRRFPASHEGELTRLRATLVSRTHLGEVAARIGLGEMLLLGRGEEQSGGRTKPALLANAMEAVIAALYLDGGLAAAQSFVEQQIVDPAMPKLEAAVRNAGKFSGAVGDYKSALQEHLQGAGMGKPQYVLTDQTGPDHRKQFRIEVRIENGGGASRTLGESAGSTKKQAQQDAARMALERLLEERAAPAAEAAG